MSFQRPDLPARLVAVVATHNRLAQIKTTIKRLLAEPVDRIVVVDNASTDGTQDWLRAQTEARLHPVLMAANLGGAGGFETGMRLAVDRYDPDWLVVMDDDARPAPGALGRFLARDLAGDLEGVDALAAAVRYPDGRICEINRPSRSPFRHKHLLLTTLLHGRMGFHLPDSAYRESTRAVDVASFVGLFLSRNAIRRAGYPDGQLFVYGEDAIYTLGLTGQGLHLQFDPGIRFQHDCRSFHGPARIYTPLWKVYYNYRNGLILYRQTAGPLFFWPVLLVVLPKWLLNGRHYGPDKRRYYRLLGGAIRDGLRGLRHPRVTQT